MTCLFSLKQQNPEDGEGEINRSISFQNFRSSVYNTHNKSIIFLQSNRPFYIHLTLLCWWIYCHLPVGRKLGEVWSLFTLIKFQTQPPLSRLQAWSYLQLTSHSDCSLSRVEHPAVLCGSRGESHVININKLCSSPFVIVSKETRQDMNCSSKKVEPDSTRRLDLKIIVY